MKPQHLSFPISKPQLLAQARNGIVATFQAPDAVSGPGILVKLNFTGCCRLGSYGSDSTSDRRGRGVGGVPGGSAGILTRDL